MLSPLTLATRIKNAVIQTVYLGSETSQNAYIEMEDGTVKSAFQVDATVTRDKYVKDNIYNQTCYRKDGSVYSSGFYINNRRVLKLKRDK